MINEVNKNSIIAAVAAHNVRWIKNNFYTVENYDELSISILISEITKYKNPQGKERDDELPPSLVSYYENHYSNNPEAVEKINEAILNDFVQNKKILLIFENENSNSKRSKLIIQRLNDIKNCDVVNNLAFSQDIGVFVKNLDDKAVKPQYIDFVLCCLSKINNYQDVVSKLTYLIGRFGKDKMCVLYDHENSDLLSFLSDWNIVTDNYDGIGITM
ncbi:MAG: hypothetical protein LBM93_11955 [Oscillospiraceae bacterium]|jgi:hypothetical protein|nr:hypothetical protein [Oscillospiraceae bacterium]